MATFNSKSFFFIAFFCLLCLSPIDGVACTYYYPGVIWKGPCFSKEHCDSQCRQQEGALFGNSGYWLKCLCVYGCNHFGEGPSATFKGPCFGDVVCSKHCRANENAFTGR